VSAKASPVIASLTHALVRLDGDPQGPADPRSHSSTDGVCPVCTSCVPERRTMAGKSSHLTGQGCRRYTEPSRGGLVSIVRFGGQDLLALPLSGALPNPGVVRSIRAGGTRDIGELAARRAGCVPRVRTSRAGCCRSQRRPAPTGAKAWTLAKCHLTERRAPHREGPQRARGWPTAGDPNQVQGQMPPEC
jgi:hypothetical protein